MAWFAIAATVASSLLAAKGAQSSAAAARENAAAIQAEKQYEAAQLESNAMQVTAAGQRKAAEDQRMAKIVASRALAVAAASGGGASDPTIVRLMSRIAGEGEYRRAVDIYDAEDRARTMRMRAAGSIYEGQQALRSGESMASAYETKALGSIVGMGASLFWKYGGGSAGGSGDASLLRDTSSYATSENPWGASI